MSHFRLLERNDIHNGPVDYSTPVGHAEIWLCSNTVKDHIERRKPVTKKFTSDDTRDKTWIGKFRAHTGADPEYVRYAKSKSGMWYVQAVYI